MAGVGLAPRRPMGAKDAGDLQARQRHAALVRGAAIGSRVEAPMASALGRTKRAFRPKIMGGS